MGATVSELTGRKPRNQNPVTVWSRARRSQNWRATNQSSSTRRPANGLVVALPVKPGEVLQSGALFLKLETEDASLRHLESRRVRSFDCGRRWQAAKPDRGVHSGRRGRLKLAQEAGLDPADLTDIEATGPGGAVRVTTSRAYLARRVRLEFFGFSKPPYRLSTNANCLHRRRGPRGARQNSSQQ